MSRQIFVRLTVRMNPLKVPLAVNFSLKLFCREAWSTIHLIYTIFQSSSVKFVIRIKTASYIRVGSAVMEVVTSKVIEMKWLT